MELINVIRTLIPEIKIILTKKIRRLLLLEAFGLAQMSMEKAPLLPQIKKNPENFSGF